MLCVSLEVKISREDGLVEEFPDQGLSELEGIYRVQTPMLEKDLVVEQFNTLSHMNLHVRETQVVHKRYSSKDMNCVDSDTISLFLDRPNRFFLSPDWLGYSSRAVTIHFTDYLSNHDIR